MGNGTESLLFTANGTALITDQYYPTVKQPLHMVVIYSLAYTAVFLFALFGNIMVVVVVYRNTRMHTVTNYFIVNLAVADILVAIVCVPMTFLHNIYSGWPFGAFMCKATPYLQGVTVCASVNTLAVISVDRFLAICYTLKYQLKAKTCKIVMIFIWIFSIIIMIPWAVVYQKKDYNTTLQNYSLCLSTWESPSQERGYTLGVIFLSCYSIPLLLIIGCYSLIGVKVWNRNAPGISNNSGVIFRSKVKVVKMLITVVALFSLSWMPLYVIQLKRSFGCREQFLSSGCRFIAVATPIAQWLGLSNSGVNPVIYCFFSKKFRRGFKQVVTCFRKPNHDTVDVIYRMSSTHYTAIGATEAQVSTSGGRQKNLCGKDSTEGRF